MHVCSELMLSYDGHRTAVNTIHFTCTIANDILQCVNVNCTCPGEKLTFLHAPLLELETHCGLELLSLSVTRMKFSFAIASSPCQKEHLGAVTMVLYLDGVLGSPTDATLRS